MKTLIGLTINPGSINIMHSFLPVTIFGIKKLVPSLLAGDGLASEAKDPIRALDR